MPDETSGLSSRERMLAAIDRKMCDYVPCSFMIFVALERKSSGPLDFVRRQVELGLDPFVQIPARHPNRLCEHADLHSLPVRFDSRVEVREFCENRPGQRSVVLCKEYQTPAGTLRAEVSRSDDWPYGDHVPFLDDYIAPRSLKFVVERPDDLDPLKYLLTAPTDEDIADLRAYAARAKDLADRHGLLTTAGWGVGADMIAWLSGLQNAVYLCTDQPEFLHALIDTITAWNRRRMEVMLEAGVDLFIQRAWYETTDFWSPQAYREYLLEPLKGYAALAHSAGARFGYINTSSNVALLDCFVEAGVDVLIGVDPCAGEGRDMSTIKQALAGKVALWGGVNGFLTVEMGSREDIDRAVERAIEVLAPGGGFILGPVDNVRDESAQTRQNVLVFIEAWKRLR